MIGRSWVQIQNNFAFYKHIDEKKQINGKQVQRSNTGEQVDYNRIEYVDFVYNKPKWYNVIYEPTEQLQGKILVSCAIFPKLMKDGTDSRLKIPKVDSDIKPSCDRRKLHMYCIGLRDIIEDCGDFKPKNLYVKFTISIDGFDPISTQRMKIKEGGINLNEELVVEIDVPRNKKL